MPPLPTFNFLGHQLIVCEIVGDGGNTDVAIVHISPNADINENETFMLDDKYLVTY